ncbi:MAG TPA: hypothetical protein VFW47_15670 [Phenylobacterium sp.]|nr:hypothetical protein [Phenylobacterium sp.]
MAKADAAPDYDSLLLWDKLAEEWLNLALLALLKESVSENLRG